MHFHRFCAALIVALGCVYGLAPSALAWGSCARGEWKYPGEISHCECASGQKGFAYQTESGVYVRDQGGQGHGWVAVEFEAYDVWGRRAFVPASYGEITCTRYDFMNPNLCVQYGVVYRPIKEDRDGKSMERVQMPWPWATAHSYTERYRSVCLTYHPDFTYSSYQPWGY